MLALIRMIKNLRDREHFLRTRYHREHPHFLLFIALDAILTVALVGGGYSVAASHGILQRTPEILADLGASSLNITELKAQVLDHRLDMYWVGPVIGAKYATEVLNPSSVTLNYVAASSAAVTVDDPFTSVQTYNDPEMYATTTKGPIHDSADVSLLNSLGDQVTFNPSERTHVVVHLVAAKKVVVIRYSSPQPEYALVQDSEKLRVVP